MEFIRRIARYLIERRAVRSLLGELRGILFKKELFGVCQENCGGSD